LSVIEQMFEEYSDSELLEAFTTINNSNASKSLAEKARLMELEFIKRALKFIDAGGLNPH
jgi:hypothetical protein